MIRMLTLATPNLPHNVTNTGHGHTSMDNEYFINNRMDTFDHAEYVEKAEAAQTARAESMRQKGLPVCAGCNEIEVEEIFQCLKCLRWWCYDHGNVKQHGDRAYQIMCGDGKCSIDVIAGVTDDLTPYRYGDMPSTPTRSEMEGHPICEEERCCETDDMKLFKCDCEGERHWCTTHARRREGDEVIMECHKCGGCMGGIYPNRELWKSWKCR